MSDQEIQYLQKVIPSQFLHSNGEKTKKLYHPQSVLLPKQVSELLNMKETNWT